MKKNLYPKIHIQEIQRNQTLICNGVTLTVCADVGDPGQWSLVIQNEYGVTTHWPEFFKSSKSAIHAGIKAIRTEGVAPFSSKHLCDDGCRQACGPKLHL